MDNFSNDIYGIDPEYERLQNMIAISGKLNWLAQPKSLTTLMDIFATDPQLLYRLACVGVPAGVFSQPARQLAASAVTLRMISFNGACLNEPRKGADWRLDSTKNVPGAWFEFTREEVERVRDFVTIIGAGSAKVESVYFPEKGQENNSHGKIKSHLELAFQNCGEMDAIFTFKFKRDASPLTEFNKQACLDSVMCRMMHADYAAMSPLFPVRIVSGETKDKALEKFTSTIDGMKTFPGYR